MVQRRDVPQALGAERRDRLARGVGHAHAEQQRVHERADDHVAAALHLGRRVVRVHVHRARRPGQHAEEMILGLGDGVARPVPVDVAYLELLEGAAEAVLASIVDGHQAPSSRPLPISSGL